MVNKRVIKLGINERASSKANKENQPNFINEAKEKKEKEKEVIKTEISVTERTKTETFFHFKSTEKTHELNEILSLVKESINRFETATEDYRSVVLPFEHEFLRK